jgi:CHAT domain-containing protein
VAFSPIDLTDIREHLQTLRFQFDKFHYEPSYLTSHAERLQKGTEICLHELWQALIAPIAPRIAGKRLIFIPFGVLHNVPFQALFDGEHYLIEDHEITQAPSARLLQLCTGRAFQVGEQATIFGIADQNTPHITAEIEAIRALFPSAQCFVGAEATAAAFTTAASGSNILHLASHALFRQDNPLFSAFKLSDTWLNLYDIGALRLPASLVTLSGCNTGASRVYAGDELMGLARGFLAAGAAALVVSLWAVNDEATAQLMTAFYQNLRAGLPPRTALREATLAAKSRFSHPYFWSPFVLLSHT